MRRLRRNGGGRTRRHLTWTVGGLAACLYGLAAPAALAQNQNVCFAPEDPSAPGKCGGLVCDGEIFETFEDAVAGVAALPDLPDGSRPAVELCLFGGAESEPYVGSLTVDNSNDVLADPLTLNFNHRPLCPTPGASESQPVLELVTNGDIQALRVRIDLGPNGPCPGVSPGVLVRGGGHEVPRKPEPKK